MKILFLGSYYYPEVFSSSYLVDNRYEGLCNEGFDVVLITPSPSRNVSHDLRKKYSKIRREECYDGRMIIKRFRMFPEPQNIYLRGVRYILCNLVQFWKGLFEKNIDCIFTVSTPPTSGFFAALLKKIKKVKFVYSVQDIFPDSLCATGISDKKSLAWRVGNCIANFTYKNADKIIVISDEFKANLINKGIQAKKIEIVYNWVDEAVIKPINHDDNVLYDKFKIPKGKFNVVYAGNMGMAQNIDIIIEAAKILKDQSGIQFILFGQADRIENIKEKANLSNLTNVYCFPLQPYELVSSVYSLGDACVVSCKKGFGGCAMPSKTWSIMACGSPVLASFDEGELKDIIEKNNCGIFTSAENASELADAIFKLYSDEGLKTRMGFNGRNFIEHNLTKSVGVKRYSEILRGCINSK